MTTHRQTSLWKFLVTVRKTPSLPFPWDGHHMLESVFSSSEPIKALQINMNKNIPTMKIKKNK